MLWSTRTSEHLLIRPSLYLNCLWLLQTCQWIVLHGLQNLHIGQPWVFLSQWDSHTETKSSSSFNYHQKTDFIILFSKLFLHVFVFSLNRLHCQFSHRVAMSGSLFVCTIRFIFTESAPLGRFSHRVTMPVCVCFCGSVPSAPLSQLVLMIHSLKVQHVPLIYSRQVNFDMFSFKTAVW